MNRISLSGSMRSNLLSLQNTAKLQSATQERMATGKKVNSAIDNPSSYYTASSLSNRAEDLNALLDSMSQSAQTLKAVVQTLESGSKFLEQASALTMQTLENVSTTKPAAPEPPARPPYTGPIAARVTTEAELLDAINNTAAADGVIVIDGDIALSKNIGLTLKAGQKLVGKGFVEGSYESPKLTLDFDSTTKAIGIELAKDSELSDLVIDYSSANKTNSNGFHAVRNNGYSGVKLTNLDITVNCDNNANMYMSGIRNVGSGEITLEGKINISAPSTVGMSVWGIYNDGTSSKLIQAADSELNISTSGQYGYGIYQGTNTLSGTVNIITSGQYGYGINGGINTLSGTVNISTSGQNGRGIASGTNTLSGAVNISIRGQYGHGINGGTNTLSGTVNITISGTQGYGIYVGMNTFKSSLNMLVQTAQSNSDLIYNNGNSRTNTWEAGAQIGYKNFDSSINALWQAGANGTVTNAANYNDLSQAPFGWNTVGTFPQAEFDEAFAPRAIAAALTAVVAAANNADDTPVITNPDKLKDYAQQYNSILDQFNSLINDGGYKGVNLLNENSLKVNFNEDRSSKLEIKGVDASTHGLGLEKANWTTLDDINNSIKELTSAINQIRDYSSEFGNYHTIISNREDFTQNMINVLNEGADKLTLADMNEESANMLALQTRQQLAVNSLSLSSQASQSILKLF